MTMAENGSSPLSNLAITMIATGLVAALIVVGIVYYLYRRSSNKNGNRDSMADVTRDRQSMVKMSPKAVHHSLSRGNTSYDKSNDGSSLYRVPSPRDYFPASPSPLSSNRWSYND